MGLTLEAASEKKEMIVGNCRGSALETDGTPVCDQQELRICMIDTCFNNSPLCGKG